MLLYLSDLFLKSFFHFLLFPEYWLFFSNNYKYKHYLSISPFYLSFSEYPLININKFQSHMDHSLGWGRRGQGRRPFYARHFCRMRGGQVKNGVRMWLRILASPLTSCGALVKSHSLSLNLFPPLYFRGI